MNSIELYEKVVELDAFNEKFKTKPIYQANFCEEISDFILSANVIGFINHGKKYELLEIGIIDKEKTKTYWNFYSVEDFSKFTDKNVNYVKIMNDALEQPKDRVKEFFSLIDCESYNSDYVYEEDIILKDFMILCEKRIIDGIDYEGPYSTFYGKFIEKEEYEKKFTSEKSNEVSLFGEARKRAILSFGSLIYIHDDFIEK